MREDGVRHRHVIVSRTEAPRWIVLFIANLAKGALLTTVIGYWARAGGAEEGARIGALLGFLAILGFDLTLAATSNVFASLRAATVDMFGFTLTFAIGGGVVGAVLGRQ